MGEGSRRMGWVRYLAVHAILFVNMEFDTEIFFLIVLSGFITVWTFRYFTGLKKTGDFEYLGLSAFWGLFNIIVLELLLLNDKTKISQSLANPYAAGFVLCILGFLFGWGGARFLKMIREEFPRKRKK